MLLFPLMLLCLVLAVTCQLWTVIRVARESPWLALGTFLFFPLALIHLLRHWGEEHLDIRTPFFAALAFAGLSFYASERLLVWAAKSEAANQEMVQNELTLAGEEDDSNDAIDRRINVAKLSGALQFTGGRVALDDAHATLEVPAHFRFVRADQLRSVANAMGRGLEPSVLGWIVHDQVSLSEAHAWIVEVRWFPLGHVADSEPAQLAAASLIEQRKRVLARPGMDSPVEFEWLGFLYQPEWNANLGALTWAEHTSYPESQLDLADCYADMPGRNGVLRYSAEFLERRRTELGFRAARLMAAHTRFQRGWARTDYSSWWDHNSGFRVADLASGAAFAP